MHSRLQLIDTHCHINVMVKPDFDAPLNSAHCANAKDIIFAAKQVGVAPIINVGTSLIESQNCVRLAREFDEIFATIGIHPTDLTSHWKSEIKQLYTLLQQDEAEKIVGIGECGLDFFHPNFIVQRQIDAFHAQIELALEFDRALVVHSRDAYDETLKLLEQYKKNNLRAVIHCFSYDKNFADTVISWNLLLGIGGTITYPKNELLRTVVRSVELSSIVLETDAPFLPPQSIRGKQNHPKMIAEIAQFVAELRKCSVQEVAEKTTGAAKQLFNLRIEVEVK